MLLGVVTISFGIGLRTHGQLSSVLRITIVAIGVIAVSFGVGLRIGCLRRGGLRIAVSAVGFVAFVLSLGLRFRSLLCRSLSIEIQTVRFIALANRVRGSGFSAVTATGFLIGTILGGSFAVQSIAAFPFVFRLLNILHGDFARVFGGLHHFARHSAQRLLVFVSSGCDGIGFVHLANRIFVAGGRILFGAR